MKKLFICLFAFLLTGCVHKLQGIEPVEHFDVNKYMGKWYEIARLDNTFEKGLIDILADYSLNPNGTVKVVNSGIDKKTGKLSKAVGVAKFVGSPEQGFLKVSFFRPFYGAYVVFDLGDDYAYVAGDDKKYLWFLSRKPTVSESRKKDFIDKANKAGFELSTLVWPEQH